MKTISVLKALKKSGYKIEKVICKNQCMADYYLFFSESDNFLCSVHPKIKDYNFCDVRVGRKDDGEYGDLDLTINRIPKTIKNLIAQMKTN